MELLGIVLLLGFYFYVTHIDEWRSDNRISPPGYEQDWAQANEDIRKYGKQYYYQQHLRGKYDVKKK